MIDYALGSKSHKSYIEIGEQCTSIELYIMIDTNKYKISTLYTEQKQINNCLQKKIQHH